MAISSIHIEKGNLSYLFHNDRSKQTTNAIFHDEKNEVDRSAIEAVEMYRSELRKRSEAYTKRTGKKLQKNTITHFSAVVNLQEHHTLQDVKKVANFLEKSLGTKVFQIAIHRDEGHTNEQGEAIKNYHAHIEFMGLDEEGRSIRRKLTRSFLINLQTKVAELLEMQRGTNYAKEQKKRPRRLDTYEYKEHAKRAAKQQKELKKELEQERKKRAELEEELAKMKDLKELNKQLRAKLQEAQAIREDYAQLEALMKELQERIRNKEITISQLQERLRAKEKELIKEIEERKKVEKENEKLRKRIYELEQKLKELHKQLQERRRAQERQKTRKEFNELKRELKTILKQAATATGYNMPIATLAQNIADAVVAEIEAEEMGQQNRPKRPQGGPSPSI